MRRTEWKKLILEWAVLLKRYEARDVIYWRDFEEWFCSVLKKKKIILYVHANICTLILFGRGLRFVLPQSCLH